MTRILLGVTGSAACFKAVALCSELVQSGHEVQPVLTRSASRLVTPLQFSCVAGCRALDDEWEPSDPDKVTTRALTGRLTPKPIEATAT